MCLNSAEIIVVLLAEYQTDAQPKSARVQHNYFENLL